MHRLISIIYGVHANNKFVQHHMIDVVCVGQVENTESGNGNGNGNSGKVVRRTYVYTTIDLC